MKRLITATLLAFTLALSGTSALAHEANVDDRYEDNVLHPLQLAYYLVHPIGFTVEWLVGRPFQYIISRDGFRNIFGWEPLTEESSYRKLGGHL